MIVSVTAMLMTFETTVPSVLVTACCAPMTSLLRRDCRAPVCARVKNASGMLLHMVEHRDPQVVDQPFADPGREPALHEREQRVREGEADRGDRERGDERAVLVGNGVVDEAAEEQRRDRRGDRAGDHGERRNRSVALRYGRT